MMGTGERQRMSEVGRPTGAPHYEGDGYGSVSWSSLIRACALTSLAAYPASLPALLVLAMSVRGAVEQGDTAAERTA